EEGARELAHQLAERGLLFRDPATGGTWKVTASLSEGGRFEVTSAVLVRRTALFRDPPGAPGGPECYPGAIAFARPADKSALGIPGFP
ncbi:hypothetical protein, partial [Staphylococcus aureus]